MVCEVVVGVPAVVLDVMFVEVLVEVVVGVPAVVVR